MIIAIIMMIMIITTTLIRIIIIHEKSRNKSYSIEDWMDESIQELNENIKKSKERLITAASK